MEEIYRSYNNECLDINCEQESFVLFTGDHCAQLARANILTRSKRIIEEPLVKLSIVEWPDRRSSDMERVFCCIQYP